MLNERRATIILSCPPADQFTSLMVWLSKHEIAFAQTPEDIKTAGYWCVAGDLENSYYTLCQAIFSEETGWFINDTARLLYATH